jgi:hypothetical protein
MRTRGWGWGIGALGLVLAIAGLVVMFVVAPALKKLPADTNVTRHYQGTMPVVLNPQTFQFMRNLPIELTRHFAVVKTDGNVALVKETKTMTSMGQPLEQVINDYAIDRTTMLAAGSYPSSWKGAPGLFDRKGIVLSWPIGTKKKDYTGWSDDYRSTVQLKFAGEVTHPRSGLKTYLFTSVGGPAPIASAEVQRMGLPTGLPKKQLLGLISQAKMDPSIVKMLPQLLAKIPGDTVPLQYSYSYQGWYWIDPTTGILIDTKKHELRKVGLGDQVIGATPLAFLPEAQKDALRVAVSDYTYTATDASVQDAKKDAQDKGGTIRLYGTTLPLVGIIAGVVLLAAGGVLVARRPKTA